MTAGAPGGLDYTAPGVAADNGASRPGADTLGWTIFLGEHLKAIKCLDFYTRMTDNPVVSGSYTLQVGKTVRVKAGQSFRFNCEEYHTLHEWQMRFKSSI